MKTAVEWLVEQLNLHEYEDVIKQAKEMEKSQHDNTAEEWWKEGAHYIGSGGKCKWESFEQYYKITFKSE
jgi:hypothetical protein